MSHFRLVPWPRPLAAALLSFAAIAAHADIGLFSTGLDASGTVLAIGDIDPHYRLVDGSSVYGVNDAAGFPGYWMAPSGSSKWITVQVDSGGYAADLGAGATFTVRTQFDLSGYDLGSAVLNGRVAADNQVVDVLLNGQSLGVNWSSYGSFANFTAMTGFAAGVNTLDFIVDNWGGPMGLRTELDGSFTALPVPEPGSLLMLATGLVGLQLRRRRLH